MGWTWTGFIGWRTGLTWIWNIGWGKGAWWVGLRVYCVLLMYFIVLFWSVHKNGTSFSFHTLVFGDRYPVVDEQHSTYELSALRLKILV
jgi:hypothetical protein